MKTKKIKINELKLLIKRREKDIKVRERQIKTEKKEIKVLKKTYKKAVKEKKKSVSIPISKTRIRRQVAINYKYKNIEDESIPLSFLSIRAITINPNITEKGLLIAINRAKKKLEVDYNLYHSSYTGLALQPIPNSEDTELNDYEIHIEVVKNQTAIRYTL